MKNAHLKKLALLLLLLLQLPQAWAKAQESDQILARSFSRTSEGKKWAFAAAVMQQVAEDYAKNPQKYDEVTHYGRDLHFERRRKRELPEVLENTQRDIRSKLEGFNFSDSLQGKAIKAAFSVTKYSGVVDLLVDLVAVPAYSPSYSNTEFVRMADQGSSNCASSAKYRSI